MELQRLNFVLALRLEIVAKSYLRREATQPSCVTCSVICAEL